MIGEKLKELRKARNLTQNDISKMLDIRQSTYSGYENNEHEPDIKTLIKIADILKVSLDYLCNRF